MKTAIGFSCLLFFSSAASVGAQTSTNFEVVGGVVNQGGNPEGGSELSSSSFSVRIDAIGSLAHAEASSTSFLADAGGAAPYTPPGEVIELNNDRDGLSWSADRSALTYNVYRGLLSELQSGSTGGCLLTGISDLSAADSSSPPDGEHFFYVVTAVNRISEEGSKGADSDSNPRANAAPCS